MLNINSLNLVRTTLFLILLLNSPISFGQDSSWFTSSSFFKFGATYSPCLIQKKDGSFMKCYSIDHKKYSPKGVLHYLESTEGKRKGVKVRELQSIQFIKNRYEMITPVPKGREFMALKAVEGDVSLYLFTEIKHLYFPFSSTYHNGLIKVKYDRYHRFLNSENKFFVVKKGKFKENMTSYFKNQPVIVEKINNDIYNFKNMEIMVSEYNSLNLGDTNWSEKAIPYEEVRPGENTSYLVSSANASQASGPKMATIYVYSDLNKKRLEEKFKLYDGDSLLGNLKLGSVYKFQFEKDLIKEFSVIGLDGKKDSFKFLLNTGRVYYMRCHWDAKYQKYILIIDEPAGGEYYLQLDRNKTK